MKNDTDGALLSQKEVSVAGESLPEDHENSVLNSTDNDYNSECNFQTFDDSLTDCKVLTPIIKSRYGRAHKPKLSGDFLPTDRKIGAILGHSPKRSPLKSNGIFNSANHHIATNVRLKGRQMLETLKNLPESPSSDVVQILGESSTSCDSQHALHCSTNSTTPQNSSKSRTFGSSSGNTKSERISRGYVIKPLDSVVGEPPDWKAGDLVWARVTGYPFWPALITMDSEVQSFTKNKAIGRMLSQPHLHVQFFKDMGRHSWLPYSSVVPYNSLSFSEATNDALCEIRKNPKTASAFHVKPSQRSKFLSAATEADDMLDMDRDKRLKTFASNYPPATKQTEKENLSHSTEVKQQYKRKNSSEDIQRPAKKLKTEVGSEGKEKVVKSDSNPQLLGVNDPAKKDSGISKNAFTCYMEKNFDDFSSKHPEMRDSEVKKFLQKKWNSMRKSIKSKYDANLESRKNENNGQISSSSRESTPEENSGNSDLLRTGGGLFRGIRKEKVCLLCFKPGDTFKCRGPCFGYYHPECVATELSKEQAIADGISLNTVKRRRRKKRRIRGKAELVIKKECLIENDVGEIGLRKVEQNVVKNKGETTEMGDKHLSDKCGSDSTDCLEYCISKVKVEFEEENRSENNENIFSRVQAGETVNEVSKMSNVAEDDPVGVNELGNVEDKPSVENELTSVSVVPSEKHSFNKSDVESAVEIIADKGKKQDLKGDNCVSEHCGSSFRRVLEDNSRDNAIDNEISSETLSTEKNGPKMDQECGRITAVKEELLADGDDSSEQYLPEEAEISEGFLCHICIKGGEPRCFACGKETEESNRQQCSLSLCGKYYHTECLKMWPQATTNGRTQQKNRNKDSKKNLICPLHKCHTCASDDPRNPTMRYTNESLVRCVQCPTAYHTGDYCVPAGCEILSISQLLCARHYQPLKGGKIPHFNTAWCFLCSMGGSLICCDLCPTSFHADCLRISPPEGSFICEDCETGRFPIFGEIVWVKLGVYRWWPAKILYPNEVPDNINKMPHTYGEFCVKFFGSNDHFWVNRGRVFLYQDGDDAHSSVTKTKTDSTFLKALEEARDALKKYVELKEARDAKVRSTIKPPSYIRIKTNKPVGNVRHTEGNTSNITACDCDPKSKNPCGPDSDCLNRILLVECSPLVCKAGINCGNQRFEKRQYPELQPYLTEDRGWGLKTLTSLRKGDFVIEYVGEMINEEEYRRRIQRKHEEKDENFYFLTIDKDRMLDAGPKGNVARFMNHSCQPNCETQKWTVNGDTRVGLFALEDIPANTELTFNYNLECIGTDRKPCMCRAPNCSGFIGVKSNNKPVEDEHKLRALKHVEKRRRTGGEETCFSCGDPGELIHCNHKNCPKLYHKDCVSYSETQNKKWICPWHHCNKCNKRTVQRCNMCTNAFCIQHAKGRIRPDGKNGYLCPYHDKKLEARKGLKGIQSKTNHSSSSSKMKNQSSFNIKNELGSDEKMLSIGEKFKKGINTYKDRNYKKQNENTDTTKFGTKPICSSSPLQNHEEKNETIAVPEKIINRTSEPGIKKNTDAVTDETDDIFHLPVQGVINCNLGTEFPIVKRKRGRPRKRIAETPKPGTGAIKQTYELNNKVRKRGRPRKIVPVVSLHENVESNGINETLKLPTGANELSRELNETVGILRKDISVSGTTNKISKNIIDNAALDKEKSLKFQKVKSVLSDKISVGNDIPITTSKCVKKNVTGPDNISLEKNSNKDVILAVTNGTAVVSGINECGKPLDENSENPLLNEKNSLVHQTRKRFRVPNRFYDDFEDFPAQKSPKTIKKLPVSNRLKRKVADSDNLEIASKNKCLESSEKKVANGIGVDRDTGIGEERNLSLADDVGSKAVTESVERNCISPVLLQVHG